MNERIAELESLLITGDYKGKAVKRQALDELRVIWSGQSAKEEKPEDRCICGHLRSEHVMGVHYCRRGCFTTPKQAEHFGGGRPTCERFTLA